MDLWNQEVYAKDLAVVLLKHYMSPKESRFVRGMSGTGQNAATIVEGLTLGFIQNNNFKTNHNDMIIKIPLDPSEFRDEKSLIGIESPSIAAKPLVIPAPKAVSPVFKPSRNLGPILCDVVTSLDELMMLKEVLGGFTGPEDPAVAAAAEAAASAAAADEEAGEVEPPPPPTCVAAQSIAVVRHQH